MIRVDRHKLAAEVEAVCKEERARAEKHFHEQRSAADFKFAAYKHPGIVRALKEMFHGKCAYCESRFAAVQPADVEHYRPKGAVIVDSKKVKPGYFWLGAAWENLLPSCIFCNRVNRHEDMEIEGGELPQGEAIPMRRYKLREKSQGKGNHFPLHDEAARSIDRMSCEAEKPLLLNPCDDEEPAVHLAFDLNGNVHPRIDPNGLPSIKGQTTIDVLALDRPDLIAARRETALAVRGELRLFLLAVKARPRNKQVIAIHLDRLATFLKPSSVYVALAREILDIEHPDLRSNLEGMRALFPL